MTEKSYFWTGTSLGHATNAPYDSEEFADVVSAITYGYDRVHEGVIYTPDDPSYSELLLPEVSGTNVIIHTGKALVDGKLYLNSADVTFDCAAAGYHLIVVRKTWATQLIRLAKVGPDVGVPSETQTDGTLWEIPISLVHSTGVAIDSQNDLRVFLGKYGGEWRFIPAVCGYQATSFVASPDAKYGVEFPDGIISRVHTSFAVPANFANNCDIKTMFQGPSSGNLYLQMKVSWGSVGQAFNVHSATVGYATEAIIADNIESGLSYSFTDPEPHVGDIIHVEMLRNAGSASDTVNDKVYFLGWYVQYYGYF